MTHLPTLSKQAAFAALPSVQESSLVEQIQSQLQKLNQKVIILDDDPTGTQTAHDVVVLTEWSIEALANELHDPSPAVFVMHNSRSMLAAEARRINTEIGHNLAKAHQMTGRDFIAISRSDSTLRGHFPLETETLIKCLNINADGVLLVPAFMAGGRYTIQDVHYVSEGDQLIPAAQTPFANDAVFGYHNSNLQDWIVEKTEGRVKADQIASISIDEIRSGGVATVQEKLMRLMNGMYCICNAVTESDLEVIALATLHAEAAGKRFLYRTAASFATIRAGITLKPPIDAADIQLLAGGGLIIVGSYVPKSTRQLEVLLNNSNVHALEVKVSGLLASDARQGEIERIKAEANRALRDDKTVVIYTTRELMTGTGSAESLSIGNNISKSLVDIVVGIDVPYRFLIAKGGITSSDIATQALNIKRAIVIGQILPGIPIWQTEHAKLFIVFPGNVGEDNALLEVYQKLNQVN